MNLTEALKLKELKSVFHENDIEEYMYNALSKEDIDFIVEAPLSMKLELDYTSEIAKKRATSVSSAFKIALGIFVSNRPRWVSTGATYLDDTIFNKSKIEEVMLTREMMSDTTKLFTETVEDIYKITHSIPRISSNAVTLAFFEAYFNTGFYPKDMSVMYKDTPEHEAMVKEIDKLIISELSSPNSLYQLFHNDIPVPLQFNKEYDITVGSLKLKAHPYLTIDNKTILDVKTTASVKSVFEDLKHLMYIAKDSHQIEKVTLYYPRYRKMITIRVR